MTMEIRMKLREILSYIPRERFEEFSLEYKVDHQVKKLSGEVMFYLLLFSTLDTRHNSLRTLEQFYSSPLFTGLFDKKIEKAKYNSISDRLRTINVDYFKAIFECVFKKYADNYLSKRDNIIAFDSTTVTLSSKLLTEGIKVGSSDNVKGIKYSVAFSGVPITSKVFLERVYASEEVALKELIQDCPMSRDNILLFDMGLQSRNTFDEFSDEGFNFITRAREDVRYLEQSRNLDSIGQENADLIVESDLVVKLFNRKNKPTKHALRLIKCHLKKEDKALYFLTNNQEYNALDIAELYKKRWEIEVFFKFLKQHLNFSHILSRSYNGLQVEMYMALISAILVLVYKKENNLSGYKIPKLKMAQEIESLLMKEIVRLCGGDPNKVDDVWAPS